MAEWVDSAAAGGVGWLLTYLLHSSFLLGVAWVATRSRWVRRPGSTDLLWKFAMVAPLVTATAALAAGGGGGTGVAIADFERIEVRQVVEASDEAFEQIGISSLAGADAARGRIDVQPSPPSPACRAALANAGVPGPARFDAIRSACIPGPAFLWYHGLGLLWLVGALGGSAAFLVRTRRLRPIVRSLESAPAELRGELDSLLSGSRVAGSLWISQHLDSPCALGGDRVAVPDWCLAQLSRDELSAVLAHEAAHLVRRDVAWARLAEVVTAVLWVQPLNRLARDGSRDAAELVCDDWALARIAEPWGLARSIAKVSEWAVALRGPALPVVAMAGAGGAVARRVARILGSRGPTGGPSGWSAALLGLALLAPLALFPSAPAPVQHPRAVFLEGEAVSVMHAEFASGGTPSVQRRARVVVTRLRTGTERGD